MATTQSSNNHGRKTKASSAPTKSWPFAFPLPPLPSSVSSPLVASFCHGCTRCHDMKRHCSGGMPCDYCWKMDYECVPRRRIKHGEAPKEHRRGQRSGSGSGSSSSSKSLKNDGAAEGSGSDGDGGDGMEEGGSESTRTSVTASALSKIIEPWEEEKEMAEGISALSPPPPPPSSSSFLSSSISVSSSSSISSSCSPADSSSALISTHTYHYHHQEDNHHHDHSLILSELHFHRQDPRPFAALYLRIFHEMHAQGMISRKRALWMLRVWGTHSSLVEADVTWGVAAQVAKTMNITRADVEGEEMLALGPTLQEQQRWARIAAAKAKGASNALKETVRFRALDEREGGERGIRMVVFNERERFHAHAVNEGYEKFFRDPVNGYDDMLRRKSMQLFWELGHVCPEDRELYMRCVIRLSYGCLPTTSSESGFLKMVSRTGVIRLFLITRKHTVRENGEEETLFHMEPAPSSRHVSSTPWAYNRVAQNFRRGGFACLPQRGQGQGPCSGGGGGDSEGRGQGMMVQRDNNHASHTPQLPPPAPPLALCPGVPSFAVNRPSGEQEKRLHMAIMEKRAAAIFPPAPSPSALSSLALMSSSRRKQQRRRKKDAHVQTYPTKEEQQGQAYHRCRNENGIEAEKKKKRRKKDNPKEGQMVLASAGAKGSVKIDSSFVAAAASSSVDLMHTNAQQRQSGGDGGDGDLQLWWQTLNRGAQVEGHGHENQQHQQQQQQQQQKKEEEEEEEEEMAREELLTSLLPILDGAAGGDFFANAAAAVTVEEEKKMGKGGTAGKEEKGGGERGGGGIQNPQRCIGANGEEGEWVIM